MLKVYPAIFHNEENVYWVEFPDLKGCNTCGDTLEEAMALAEEALGLYLCATLEDGNDFPPYTNLNDISAPENGVLSYVSVDIDQYRKNTKAVRRTVSIPEWLADEAEKTNLSLSKILQDELKERLGK